MDAAIGVDLGHEDRTVVWPCPCAGCVAGRMAYLAWNGAERKSLALLCQWLSAEQLAQFEARRSFEVTGCDSGKRYRIAYGTMQNIAELDKQGGHIRRWCFQPMGLIAIGDVMLAQKIALETYEKKALKIANSSPRARTGTPSVIVSYGLQTLTATVAIASIYLAAWCFAEGSYLSLASNAVAASVNIWLFFGQFKTRARYRRAMAGAAP